METIEITFESHPISYIQSLEQDIAALNQEMRDNHPGHLSQESVEDVDDRYQAMLEYNWYCDETRQRITEIRDELHHCMRKLTQEQKDLYNMFKDPSQIS